MSGSHSVIPKMKNNPKITVAIPCYNESVTIEKVVTDFKHELPEAAVVVFDNNSTDDSVEKASKTGAEVIVVRQKGKGFVVQKIFEILKTDVVILVDGDDTYFASDAHKLINEINKNGTDMAVGIRLKKESKSMNGTHEFGNKLICKFLNVFFNTEFKDVLSGYRAFSKKFVSQTPLLAKGFEIETELTLQALERNFIIKEIPVNYKSRPTGSFSKIKDFSDGSRILFTIISLLRDYRPMAFFSYVAAIFILSGLLFGLRVLLEYLKTGLVLYLPTAILSIALIILGFNAFLSGLTVSAINRRTREIEVITNKKKNE